ncbi:hypothetical protein PRUPE_7G050200 [Prunus persica]|uniref:Peptidase A1 domain-containing protein n=1 Tax=Prunus persica TaxID=3760 RepID=A0A251N6W6_PRUPE|nr:hypothetical protein PRUPE_7G050200 [Prunus persica]
MSFIQSSQRAMGALSTNPLFSMAIALVLSATYLFLFSLIQADRNGGFSVELIHRDSPMSPLYNPSETVTTRSLSLHSFLCYGEGSYSKGILATERVTFGSTTGQPISLPKMVFGCGQDNEDLFNKNGSGMIGLARGSVSLISQMSSSVDGKFSYCLVQAFSGLNSSSKMSSGSEAVVSGDRKSFYYLRLEAMSVGRKRLQYNGSLGSSFAPAEGNIIDDSLSSSFAPAEGNIIVNSGTTLTLLPQDFYNKLELAVSKAVWSRRASDPRRFLSPCYRTKSGAIKAPLKYCTFHRPINRSVAVFGNMAQTNFLIGYDLKKDTVSFKPTDCTKN